MMTMLCTRKYVRIVARVCIARERLGSCYVRAWTNAREYRTPAIGVCTQVTREQRLCEARASARKSLASTLKNSASARNFM